MDLKKELISVALCTYNGALYIEKQLISILNQSHRELEIIILDDCSVDDTFSILKSYELKDFRIKLYKNEVNLGFNQNFRNALDLCTGNYIVIADQDDIWNEKKLEKMRAIIKDNFLCYHNSAYINEKGILTGKSTLSAHRFVEGNCSPQLLFNNCVSGHACMIHKELLKITPAFPENLYYDWWLAYTAACAGRITFTKEILVNHRLHEHSFTKNDKLNSRTLRIRNFNFFLNHPLTPTFTQILLKKILTAYQNLNSDRFSIKLFFLLIAHYGTFFHTRKRSLFSNIKFIFNESKG